MEDDNKAPNEEKKEGQHPPNSLDGEEIKDKTINITEYEELQEIKNKYNALLEEQKQAEILKKAEEQKKESEKLKKELNDLKEQNKKILEAQQFELEKTRYLTSHNINGIGEKLFSSAKNMEEVKNIQEEFELWIYPFVQGEVMERINRNSAQPPDERRF